jgi:acyl-CoA thioesterase-1
MRWWLGLAVAVALVGAVACGPRDEARAERPEAASSAVSAAPASPVPSPSARANRPRIVVLGDSLTAGLGLRGDESYPMLLQQDLEQAGLGYDVINAGVSGDTSAGGLSRLDWALNGDVRVLVVALGGNDALRGLPPDELQHNLAQIIERAQARGITVVLAGMEAPTNYGRDYIVAFHKIYPALARRYHVAFVPFLLQGVAGDARLNQRDGIHPTAAGARIVAENVWAVLRPIVEERTPRD